MTDFTLEPDDLEPERPAPPSPKRVSSGLHPTAAVPVPRQKGPEPVPVCVPCEACGALVVTGQAHVGRGWRSISTSRPIQSPGTTRRSPSCMSRVPTRCIAVGRSVPQTGGPDADP